MPFTLISGAVITLLIACLIVGVGLLTALVHPPERSRYRLTVEVDTPDGLKKGAVVREFSWKKSSTAFTGNDIHYTERGEAVAVDLPSGKTLFVLLNTNPSDLIEMATMRADLRRAPIAIQRARETADLYLVPNKHAFETHRREYPKFVFFEDIKDPATVRSVDPGNLSKSFGPDVALNRVTFQITSDPVTQSIEGRLPWLAELRNRRVGLNGKRNVAQTPGDLTTILGSGSFARNRAF
ncbi:hypothetical protein FSB78_11290 [Sphingomonas ginsenosidivorax]|uniref:Uncharacterized protein n=1 Tax=Sphingomonas ginsenosidivorax TaxID=862135 RepID=A0A5C6UG96_9SPHN|nr:hypothetical protein [Sphingomonas ginsenosidivorax]TXC71460.1 hypothetical protein FSB78_11290 [Sphingomonas ginsenosidivorax]